MTSILQNFIREWNFMRIFRLILAAFMFFQAISLHDYLLLGFAGLFLVQAVLNKSCCGAGGCSIDPNQNCEK